MRIALISPSMMNHSYSASGTSDHWRTQLYKAMTDMSSGSNPPTSRTVPTLEKPLVPQDLQTKAFSFPPDVPITRTAGLASQPRQLPSSLDTGSLAPFMEDIQFLQWMVLTGRIFDPQSFPRTHFQDNSEANPLQEYFSSPY